MNAKNALFTVTLPIGIWVILFSILGLIISLIIQFLNQFYSSFSSRDFTFSSQPSGSFPFSKKVDWRKPSQRKWDEIEQESEEEDSWNIEKPPTRSTFTREKLEQKLQEEEAQSTDFEVRQPPKKVSRQGSVYSYTYRELRNSENSLPFQESVKLSPTSPRTLESENEIAAQVYDANYRVLTPPYNENQESFNVDREEDQDWI